MKILQTIIALIAVVVVGVFMGWLVGASNSPVVSAVLPLIFSLIGGIGLGYISFLGRRKEIREKLEEMDGGIPDELNKLFGFTQFDLARASLTWSIATILFCVACYSGIKLGIASRSPEYPNLTEWIPSDHNLSPAEMADGHRLRLTLQAKGLSPDEAKVIFEDVFVALIDHPSIEAGGEWEGMRENLISAAVDKFSNSDTGSLGGRGPASTP